MTDPNILEPIGLAKTIDALTSLDDRQVAVKRALLLGCDLRTTAEIIALADRISSAGVNAFEDHGAAPSMLGPLHHAVAKAIAALDLAIHAAAAIKRAAATIDDAARLA